MQVIVVLFYRKNVHNVRKHFTNLMDIMKMDFGFVPLNVLLIAIKLRVCLFSGVTKIIKTRSNNIEILYQ